MAGRSHSPPLAFIAPPTLPSFTPGSFAPQQLPLYKAGTATTGGEQTGSAPPFAAPFSSPTNAATHTLSSLHEKYETLLSHERQAKELERSVWEAERYLYLQRISALEDTVKDLQSQLGKSQSEAITVVNDLPGGLDKSQSEEVATKGPPDGLVDVKPEGVVAAPRIEASEKSDQIIEQVVEVPLDAPNPVEARQWPTEESKEEVARADSPGPPEYPYPKTPKSVKGDVEPDDAQIENLLDQAGRILGKTSYKFNTYDDEYDDPEEDFKLILKPNRNFRSNWAF